MHAHAPAAPAPASARIGLLIEIAFLCLIATTPFWISSPERWKALGLVFGAIVLEALPFMLLGAMLGGVIEAFVSRERMAALMPRNPVATTCVAAAMGAIFPVCECAVVPVVRRLARKGLPAPAAVAYLLGGPIVNPIVAASTALAYTEWRMPALRLGLGYLLAVGIGLTVARLFRNDLFCASTVAAPDEHACSCGCGHDHEHRAGFVARLASAARHATGDFLSTGHYLVMGAFLAACAQVFVARADFLALAATPGAAEGGMMALAVLLNLCSEADAFVGASFRGLCPISAQLAFLLTGPMLDCKLLLMYQGLFRRRVIIALAGLILGSVFITALLCGLAMEGAA